MQKLAPDINFDINPIDAGQKEDEIVSSLHIQFTRLQEYTRINNTANQDTRRMEALQQLVYKSRIDELECALKESVGIARQRENDFLTLENQKSEMIDKVSGKFWASLKTFQNFILISCEKWSNGYCH